MYLCQTELYEIELFGYLNCVLKQKGIVWNVTIFDIETAYAR